MNPLVTVVIVVCVLAFCLLIVRALQTKGDVRAMFKAWFVTFSIEAKDKRHRAPRGLIASRNRTRPSG